MTTVIDQPTGLIYNESHIRFSGDEHDFVHATDDNENIESLGSANEMLEYLAKQNTHDLTPVPLSNISVTKDCTVAIKNGANREFQLTDTGLDGLLQYIPALNKNGICKDIDENMFNWVQTANQRLARSDKKVMPIIRDGRLAGLPSSSFALIPNFDVAKRAIRDMPDGYMFLGGTLTPKKMNLIFINPNCKISDGREEHFTGFRQKNGEIAKSKLYLGWCLFTAACTNLALMGEKTMSGIAKIHRGNLAENAEGMLNDFMDSATAMTKMFSEALPLFKTIGFPGNGQFFNSYIKQIRDSDTLGSKRGDKFLADGGMKIKDKEESLTNYLTEWSRLTRFARGIRDLDKKAKVEEVGGWMVKYVYKNAHKIAAGILN